jgi:uncharacterized protein (DUF2147 family)
MLRFLLAVHLTLCAASAMAQVTPVGLWKTISDKDGAVTSEVRILDAGGVVSGRVERGLGPDFKPGDKCGKCSDERKDQLIEGLEIIRGVKKRANEDVWDGGTILDPDNGTVYKVKLTPIENGRKLEVRGFIGFSLFGRTQTWIRVQ